jgi:hypothetical protein
LKQRKRKKKEKIKALIRKSILFSWKTQVRTEIIGGFSNFLVSIGGIFIGRRQENKTNKK